MNDHRDLKLQRNKTINSLIKFGTPLLILIFWQYFSSIGKINASVLPSPSTIIATFVARSLSGELPIDIGISIFRVFQGYLYGSILGILIGTSLAFNEKFASAFSLIFNLIRPIPIIAWVPIFIMWLGIGEVSKVSVIMFGTFFPVLMNTLQGISSTDEKFIEVARSFEKKKSRIFFSVVLPSASPAIFTGLRLGLGLAWMSVVGAEMIGASSGIGYLISYSGQLSQPAVMFMSVFTIGIIGCMIDLSIRLLEQRLMKWNVRQ